MQYVVLCHTRHLDRSAKENHRSRDVVRTHEMLRSVNKDDAVLMTELLQAHDEGVNYEDGPFITQRAYEVGVIIFTPKGKVTLTLSDVEMIAAEYTMPDLSLTKAAE